jgi:protein-disulfide isomerase-like protein with CxxC motif
MDRKNKTFDAVKMTREIRNAHYEETKDMTTEERISFYRRKAQKLH